MYTLDLNGKLVTVLGGTGFVGRHVVARLAEAGALVKVVTRHTPSAYFLRPAGTPGQIVAVYCRYSTSSEIERVIKGSYAVVNCLGILFENGKTSRFSHLHTDIPKWVAATCKQAGISRFIQISALGVDKSKSAYAITKILGEKFAREAFPSVTILRPSVIFGAEDSFFNMFARLSSVFPFLPLIGGGKTCFQPVYVEDVAKAVVHALCDIRTAGCIFELGGPEVINFKGIYARLEDYIGHKIHTVNIPLWLARVQAFLMGFLPNPPLTNDQITSLKTDNIVGNTVYDLRSLGILPTPMSEIVPLYLGYIRYSLNKDSHS